MLCSEQVQMIVGSGCIPIAVRYALTTSLYLPACQFRILLMLNQGATACATVVKPLYIHSLCQRLGCEYGNRLYVSVGLDDRYDDPYGDKMLLRYIGTCHISGLIKPKIY